MLVLGIDPGVRKLGYALVDFQNNSANGPASSANGPASSANGPAGQKKIVDSGILFDDTLIVTRQDWFNKMTNIYIFFQELIQKHDIDLIAMETLYFTSKNQSNAEFVYGIRGSLITLFGTKKIKIREIDPVQVKKYISGNGKADKKLVQAKIMQLYGLQNMPQYNDSADALGMAYIGFIAAK